MTRDPKKWVQWVIISHGVIEHVMTPITTWGWDDQIS